MKLLLAFVLTGLVPALAEVSQEFLELKQLTGEVKVDGNKADAFLQVAPGSEISAPGKGSSVQLHFKDGSRALLQNGSVKVFVEEAEKRTLVVIQRGELVFSSTRDYKFSTKSSSIITRGPSKFYIEEISGKTYVLCLEGKLEVNNDVSFVDLVAEKEVRSFNGRKIAVENADRKMKEAVRFRLRDLNVIKIDHTF
jgi:ferric-dicitrate binding protein FerR (iron transport regulator)